MKARPETSIMPFSFESQQVRVIDRGGEPWFVAKDVAESLGYVWKASESIRHIPEEWKGVHSEWTPGGSQDMLIISEQGLYFFLGRSDKRKALPFQKWIAGEVLPSIRKTGQYQLKDARAVLRKTRQAAQQCSLEWQANRTTGKVMRRELTDTIKMFIGYAKGQGSRSAERYYVNITVMINDAVLGKQAGRDPNFRDNLGAFELMMLGVVEQKAAQYLQDAMQLVLQYKSCFQETKDKVTNLVGVMRDVGVFPLLCGPANTHANLLPQQ